MLKLFIGKVKLTVLVTKFELRKFSFTKSFLEGIKFFEVINKRGALIIRAFVKWTIFTMFPEIKGGVAMGTPEFSFVNKTTM